MKLELSTFKSRIGRRLFLLFLIVIFIPLLVTGLSSYKEVSQLISYEHKENLRRTSQEYGLNLFKRLSDARRYLGIALTDLTDSTPINQDEWQLLKEFFKQLHIYRDNQHQLSLLGSGMDASLSQILATLKDERLFLIDQGENQEIWLLERRLLGDHHYIAAAQLNEAFVWPETELGAYESLCIALMSGTTIHCTEPMPNEKIQEIITQPNTPTLSWTNTHGTEMLASYWTLFMDHQFRVPDWYIITNKPESIVLSQLTAFARTYIPGALLALLLIVLLSVISIRRYLKPVDALIKGTQALSENDLTYRIQLNTNDEYQALAESFNTMARKLEDEFKVNSTLSSIDRRILVKTNIRECVEEILQSLSVLSFPNNACIFIFDPFLQPEQLIFHYNYTDNTFSEIPTNLSQLRNTLQHHSQGENAISCSADQVQAWFPQSRWPSKQESYRFYPLFHGNQLMSGLLIGQTEKQRHTRFPEFLTHTAVVFNALHREKMLERQANYDKLTGLYNRSYFQFSVNQRLKSRHTTDYQASMLFLDLDRFKNINDTLGHHTGDQLLIEAGQRILKNLPEGTIASRFGGDEFTVFVPDLSQSELVTLSQRLIQKISEIYRLGDYSANISASIGISRFPQDAESFESLLRCADMAMYQAKAKGKECFEFYSQDLSIALAHRTKLEQYLRSAIDNDYMKVVYQPKVDIQNRCLSGFEALSRFIHPSAGFISPEEVFAIAEETGMVMELGYHVMISAMKQQAAWQSAGIWQGRMAINISPIQLFDIHFIEHLDQAIYSSGVNPEHIELEITEGVFLDNMQKATERLNQIREKGITIAIDDFGTGYSSLSYISNLPIDNLKIDRSFILQLEKDKRYKGVISSIITMAQHLNLRVTAEGIESLEHLYFMIDNQCNDIQGYLYSKPLDAEESEALLKNPQTEKLFILTAL